jgi:3-oxoacyl-[acyl-carrier-protein] synthase-3
MAVRAARECLERAGAGAEEVDVIIVGTVTPDMFFPSTACLVQNEIGTKNAWGFDLLAGCSGFLFTLATAASMIEVGRANKVLAIGSGQQGSFRFSGWSKCVQDSGYRNGEGYGSGEWDSGS